MSELITVIVYAYNSEKTIIDTLDSIKKQLYHRIELIISDDSSTDETVSISEKWLKQNKECFERSCVVSHSENMGISKHFVESVKLAHGHWIKPLAGDDILSEDCLILDMAFVGKHPETEFLITDMYLFDENAKWEMSPGERAYCEYLGNKEACAQYKLLLKRDVNNSPSEFFRADIFTTYGEPNNPVRNIEDWPFRLHITKSGCKIYYMDKKTVYYRQGHTSVSGIKGLFFNPKHLENAKFIEKQLIYPNISRWDLLFWWDAMIKHLRYSVVLKMGNRVDTITTIVNRLLMIMQPSSYEKLYWEIVGRVHDRSNQCK